jgi:hypothetical protein
MKIGGGDESKKKIETEKWDMGFRYGLTLGIGTPKAWPAPMFSCV